MTKIKICGLKRPEDIAYVNAAKPDFAGFIIDVPKSRRNVSQEKVRELTALLSPEILPVGVFVNAPMETILSLANDGTLKTVQLHSRNPGLFHPVSGGSYGSRKKPRGLRPSGQRSRRHRKNL